MNKLLLLKEGLRMFKYRWSKQEYYRYNGTAKDICEAIVAERFNGTYFETGVGNYPQFWARDFGMVTGSLITLGYKKAVIKTLEYALSKYKQLGRITTHITPDGKCVNFPEVYSPDSIAYLLRSVRLVKDKKLFLKYKKFLQAEVKRFSTEALDKNGKIKRKKHFSSMRDHAIRDASCYDTVMAAIVARECKNLGLQYKFIDVDYAKILVDDYWTGSYFKDDMSSTRITADANIYPFWHDIILDKHKLKRVLISMQRKQLDKPFPIKYVSHAREKGRMILAELLSYNWEADAVWPMSGLPFIDVVAMHDDDKAKKYHEQYKKVIEKQQNFIEVYNNKGAPYKSLFFKAGEGMIWCAMWLRQRIQFNR